MSMQYESVEDSQKRVLALLNEKYPGKDAYDLDGRGLHFVCEVEPVSEHPEYDTAVEVIIKSKKHKHNVMTQRYRVLEGSMTLYVEDEAIELNTGDTYVVLPGKVHWAESDGKSLVELYSVPGWTKEDHIVVE